MYSNPPMDSPYLTPSSHQWSIPPTYPTNPSFTTPTTPSFPSFPWELFSPYYTNPCVPTSSPCLYFNHGYTPPPPNPYSSYSTSHYSYFYNNYHIIQQPTITPSTMSHKCQNRSSTRRDFKKDWQVSHLCFKKSSQKYSQKLSVSRKKQKDKFTKVIFEIYPKQPDEDIKEERVSKLVQEFSSLMEKSVTVDADFSNVIEDFGKSQHETYPRESKSVISFKDQNQTPKMTPPVVFANASLMTATTNEIQVQNDRKPIEEQSVVDESVDVKLLDNPYINMPLLYNDDEFTISQIPPKPPDSPPLRVSNATIFQSKQLDSISKEMQQVPKPSSTTVKLPSPLILYDSPQIETKFESCIHPKHRRRNRYISVLSMTFPSCLHNLLPRTSVPLSPTLPQPPPKPPDQHVS